MSLKKGCAADRLSTGRATADRLDRCRSRCRRAPWFLDLATPIHRSGVRTPRSEEEKMDPEERGPRQRRSFDGAREPRRPFDDGRERTVRWPPACRPAPELQREMDAALAEVGVSTGPLPDQGFQQRQRKAFEVVRKIARGRRTARQVGVSAETSPRSLTPPISGSARSGSRAAIRRPAACATTAS